MRKQDEIRERILEHENLLKALQGDEVDAVVVLEDEDGARLSRLQSDEPLYRTIVDSLPQSVATVLSDGTIVYLNHHFASMLGVLVPSALLGSSIFTIVSEHDEPLFRSMLQRALTSPQESAMLFHWVSGEAPALISAIRLPVAGVDAIGVVVVDVRDQVARKAAEEASRAKDDLLASVSHELRTPLASISGWVQFLEAHFAASGGEELTGALRHLKDAVQAETKIVDDLLDLARSEKGTISLAADRFDLRSALRMAASFVELQARNKSLALEIDLPDEELTVNGDPDRLRQVFVNLLSNAVKFTHEGKVTVGARRVEGWATIEVADTGIGIVAEFLPQVFESFRRSPRAHSYPGIGIGLAISRRLIEAHGGRIEVKSDGPDKGSTFTVKLPLA